MRHLHPGGLILTGAPGTVEQLRPGDVVEVEIPEIGALRNTMVSEDPKAEVLGCISLGRSI